MEVHGLALLRATSTLRVPRAHGEAHDAIVLEDLGTGRATDAAWQRAGRALAQLHAHTSPKFGLDRDGWCGDSPQRNTQTQDGWRFFAECRLLPQGKRAFDAGRLKQHDVAALERLCLTLDSGWRTRAQVYNLYHLLNHLNLFGSSYLGGVLTALRGA